MTTAVRLIVVASITALAAQGLSAAEPAELRRLFPHEADVTLSEAGLARLVLPPEILSECRPDLSDVRLFDGEGREVPYLVDRASASAGMEVTQRFAAPVLEVSHSERRREDGPPLRHEEYVIGVADEAPQTGRWTLTVDSGRRQFVARVRVFAGDEATPLVTGSLFRLSGRHSASRLRLVLPPFAADRLRVELTSEEPAWIEPGFAMESARRIERGACLDVPLEPIAMRSAEGKTVIDLERPRGVVPGLLRLETETPTYDRRVEVWDDGAGAVATALGSTELFRVEGIAPVGVDEVALSAARGDRLRVEIQDGDSPPLAAMRWTAVVPQPALIFSARGDLTLRFGGGRAHRPRYDLAGLLPRYASDERAQAAAALYETASVATAHLGEVRANADYDGAPVLAFAMRPGAEIDRGPFRRLRPLRVPDAPEGLSRLVLAPDDLAALEPDLADLRVADERSRQWPFLIERDAVDRLVPLDVSGPSSERGKSSYVLEPSVKRLETDRLLLDTDVPFFDRAYTLWGLLDGERREIASGRLVRPVGDPRPVTVEFRRSRVASLLLEVEDGDDAPLALLAVQARTSAPELYLTAPAGEYTLLLGAPDHEPARYELERVRDVVLAARAAEIEPGELRDNPDFSLAARLGDSGLRQTVLLWAALVLAVVVLGAYTLRLARRGA